MKLNRTEITDAPKLCRYMQRGKPGRVDKEQGIIHGVSVITRGEALGHRMWVDSFFVDQVIEDGQTAPKGIKSRWTHPGLSGDGMGKQIGRLYNFRRDGERAIADLHMHEKSNQQYVQEAINLADEAPDQFGSSIVFSHDVGEEDRFIADHENEQGEFNSPDKENNSNYFHARLYELHAGDLVDEPAANPAGLFSEGGELAARGEQLLDYILSKTRYCPEFAGPHPDRMRAFFQTYLNDHGLVIIKSDQVARLQRTIETLKSFIGGMPNE